MINVHVKKRMMRGATATPTLSTATPLAEVAAARSTPLHAVTIATVSPPKLQVPPPPHPNAQKRGWRKMAADAAARSQRECKSCRR